MLTKRACGCQDPGRPLASSCSVNSNRVYREFTSHLALLTWSTQQWTKQNLCPRPDVLGRDQQRTKWTCEIHISWRRRDRGRQRRQASGGGGVLCRGGRQAKAWRRWAPYGSVRIEHSSDNSTCKGPEAGLCRGWRDRTHHSRWSWEREPLGPCQTLRFSKAFRCPFCFKLLKRAQTANILRILHNHFENNNYQFYLLNAQSSPNGTLLKNLFICSTMTLLLAILRQDNEQTWRPSASAMTMGSVTVYQRTWLK